MGETVDRLGVILLDGAAAATAILGLTALAMVACGQPARRCLLARTALFGAMVLVPLAELALVPRLPWLASLRAISPPKSAWNERATATPPPVTLASDWRRAIVGVALAGTATGLGAIVLGWIGCHRLIRKTIEPASETLCLYEGLPFRSAMARPRLRVSARVRRPVLIGTFRPTIVIPPDLDEPEMAVLLRLGLLHELAHAERLDPWFGLISAVAGSFWFYVPPLWWVRRQLRLDGEFLADRRAAHRFGPTASYASSLVGMAGSDPVEGTAGVGRSEAGAPGTSPLFQRVLMLVRCPYPVEGGVPFWWRWTCVPALACGTVLASGLTLQTPPDSVCRQDGPCEHGLVQISRLTIEARRPGPDGRVRPYSLLRRLPERFELVVDVWAEPRDLPCIAIAGRRLGPPLVRPGDGPLTGGYHKVRLVRGDRGLSVWVAGRPVPPQPEDVPPPDLLTVQPAPGEVGRLRDLVWTW